MNPPPRVRDYMSASLVSFAPETSIHEAIDILLDKRLSGAPVLDATGALVGILTKRDCISIAFSASYHQGWGGPVSEYMSPEVETVDADDDIVAVAGRFLERGFRRYPVIDNGRVVGVISRHDALRALRVPAVIVSIIGFMYRYLAVLTDEAARMNRGRQARSAAPPQGTGGGSIGWRARVTGAMVGSLFIRSYERSERVFAAMLARGYDGTFRTAAMPRPTDRELAAFAVALLGIVLLVVGANAWTLR